MDSSLPGTESSRVPSPISTKVKVAERDLGFYRQELKKNLDPEIFKQNPGRLVWYVGCISLSLFVFFGIINFDLIWPLKLLGGLIIGFCNGTLGFITHEIAHGSVVKNRKIQHVLGFFGTLPFFISPTYWKYSHNRLHHGKTQKLIEDPDAFPNMRIFKSSRFMQFMFPFTPGSGHRRSILYFFFWFSFHNFVAQLYLRFRNRIFDSMDHKLVTVEFITQILIGIAMLAYAGPSQWLWVAIIPLAIQNYVVMSYISTNHNLSPLTKENDPLVNSLTVTNNRVLEFFNLNFGYHVEHHIFPTINGKNIKAVHYELLKKFPESFKVMKKSEALRALYRTPRIYKNSHQLIHPETGDLFPTI